jgi:Ca2+-binding RTX toxin-like protein
VVDTASAERGVFLWRDPDLDYTPPVVTPTVTGTLGDNGWYRSNVSVSWSVIDAQSALTATDGCADSVLAADSAGTTYTCTASSAPSAGPGSATVTVKRDVTAPTVACGVRPTFDYAQQPALVNATVADATSGAAAAVVSAAANTMVAGVGKVTVTGADRAGNRLSRACPYLVRPATCLGQAVTIRGTAGPDVLVGTAGVDVIHGYGGADRLDGVNGNDLICGGDGGDLVYGGNGADRVDGGAGSDDINGGAGDDNLAGGADADAIRGDDGADRCSSGEIRMSSCAFIY